MEQTKEAEDNLLQSTKPGLKYTYRPVYDTQNAGWTEYYYKSNNNGTIDGFLQFLNNEAPISSFRRKFDLKHAHRIPAVDINDVQEQFCEPTLYMSIDEGYCSDLFSDGKDMNKRSIGIENVRICVEFDKTIKFYFRHKEPRGNESAEKSHP